MGYSCNSTIPIPTPTPKASHSTIKDFEKSRKDDTQSCVIMSFNFSTAYTDVSIYSNESFFNILVRGVIIFP